MGERYAYTCPSCGYEAYVAGGESALMLAKTKTFQCNDCQTLMDLSTEVADPESENGAWPDFIPVRVKKCFHCGSGNIQAWDGRTCPKCGTEMIRDEKNVMMVD